MPISQTERRINKLYANFCVIRKEVSLSIIKATNRALPLAIELGGLLVEHKERIGHGNWETWVAAQEFSLATAKRWMALNRRREEVERSGVENLDEAYLLLGLKTPKRSPVSDLTDSDADTDTPDWRHNPAPIPAPEKPSEVQAASDDIKPPAQPAITESISGNGESLEDLSHSTESMSEDSESGAITCYKVDALLTIRVTRSIDAGSDEEAIKAVKRLYGGGLQRHLEAYQNCDKVEICSISWEATA